MEPFHIIQKIMEPHVIPGRTAGLEFSAVYLSDVASIVSEFIEILYLLNHRSIEGLKNSMYKI